MAGKVVNPCARCSKEAGTKAEHPKDKRVILLCAKHLPEHEEGLKKQNFVLTEL